MNPRGFDVVIDSAGGEGFGSLIRLLGMGGRLAFFGGTAGKWYTFTAIYVFQTDLDSSNHDGYT